MMNSYDLMVFFLSQQSIKFFLNETEYDRTGASIPEEKSTTVFAFIVSIFALGGGIGGLAAGWWADYFGR